MVRWGWWDWRASGRVGAGRRPSPLSPLSFSLSSPLSSHLQVADAGPHVGRQLLQLLRLGGQGVQEGLRGERESGGWRVRGGACGGGPASVRPRLSSLAARTHLALGFGGHDARRSRRLGCLACVMREAAARPRRTRGGGRGNETVVFFLWPAPTFFLSFFFLPLHSAFSPAARTGAHTREVLCARLPPRRRHTTAPPVSPPPPTAARARAPGNPCPVRIAKKKTTHTHFSKKMVDTRCANRVMTGASVGGALGASIGA